MQLISKIMIDLNELERRLDEALAKETSDSLYSWLHSQRRDDLDRYLGEGCYQRYKVCPILFHSDKANVPQYNCSNINTPSDQLAFAA